MYFTDFELDYLISEDLPLMDLTSMLLSLEEDGNISFIFRQDGIVLLGIILIISAVKMIYMNKKVEVER